MRLGEELMGELRVVRWNPRDLSAIEAELLEGLAAQAAVAIERARLVAELRSLATLQERERIAREMHDGLAQSLGVLLIRLKLAEKLVDAQPATSDALREMTQLVMETYADVRQSIFGLRTNVGRALGLVATLTEYLHEFGAQNGVDVQLEVAGGVPLQLSPASEVQAIRIIQEALSNVRKHAGARRAWVRLRPDGRYLQMVIEDYGSGWDAAVAPVDGRVHFGLDTMRERAEGIGGSLQVDSAPGRGTRVTAVLPRDAS
jgi:signal transduction histidine kinase